MKYLSTFEVAEKWGISPRRVGILCNNDRIKSGKYIKQKADRQKEA